MEVGIRDLRNHLSKYLAGVAQGDELIVTDHGQPVARILPVNVPRPIDRLIAEGLIQPATDKSRSSPARRIKAKEPVSELVAQQRR